MSIFQKSVINNHLSQLDKDQVEQAFIQAELATNQSEINNIIYRLYGLTDNEIAIVENV